ncbi:MAG: biopolymer transporter ExbD [Hyphomicrobiaceae bacterium]|nr:MAG: biopolymer transporter ExbD [Hyphomicrobiaceae bacterium]
MAASVQTPARPGGGRRGRARKHAPMHEINVTPFVDVMLVLLIVFMVAAPLLLSGLPVDLPNAKGQSLNLNKDPLTITVDRNGRIFLGAAEEPLEVAQLLAKLRAIVKNAEEDPILFRGDRQVVYGRVSEVISAVREGGFKKFTFVSGPEDIEKGPAKR